MDLSRARVDNYFLWLLPALLLFSRAIADITVVLVGLAFLYHSYKYADWNWLHQPWLKAVLMFWAYLLLVNAPLSILPVESFKYALTFIRWPLFAAALAYWLLRNQKQQQSFLAGLLVTSLLVVADTGWQYLFGADWFGIKRFDEERLTGPFRNPVPGTLMLRLWFIALFGMLLWQVFTTRSRIQGLMIVLALLLGLGFMFITGERMALMLFATAGLLIVVAYFFEYPSERIPLLAGLVAMAILLWLLMESTPHMTERSVYSIVDKLANFHESDYGLVFAAAWEVWQQHFWLGNGLHSYQQVCQQMDLFANSNMRCTHPHNLYLQLGAETGLIGAVLFISMLAMIYITALRQALKKRCYLHLSMSFSILTVSFWPLIGGISVFNNWIGALVWLGVGWVLAVSAVPLPSRSQPKAVPAG